MSTKNKPQKQIKIIITIIIFILLIPFIIQIKSYGNNVMVSDLENSQNIEDSQQNENKDQNKNESKNSSSTKNKPPKIQQMIKQERDSKKTSDSFYQSVTQNKNLTEQYQKDLHIKNYLNLEIFVRDIKGNKILSNIKIETPSLIAEQQTKSEFKFSPLKPGKITIYIYPLQQNLQKIIINSNIEKDSKLFLKIPPSEFFIQLSLFDLFNSLSPTKLNYQLYLNNTLYQNHKIQENSIIIPLKLKEENLINTALLNQEEIESSLKVESIISSLNISFKNNKSYKDEKVILKITPNLIRNTFPQYRVPIFLENKLPNPYVYPILLSLISSLLALSIFYLLREILNLKSLNPKNLKINYIFPLKFFNPFSKFQKVMVEINRKPQTAVQEKLSLATVVDHDANPKVADYILLERLGTGATAIVYKAQNIKNKSIVALKLIHKHLFQEPWFQERIKNEIEINKILAHPNIVKLVDYNLEGDQIFLAFEFVEGKSLSKIMQEKKKLQLNEALDIWMQILEALDYAHQKGVIHRDLKPDNILIKQDKTVKITDFGISKKIDTTLNLTQDFVGTPWYMSPEQIKNQKVDNRSDIYSLGVIVYQMLTGKLPFETSENIYAVFKAHMFDNPVSTNLIFDNSYIPPDIEKIIRKMVEKDPKKRYQYCYEIIQDLTPYLLTYKK